MNKDLKGIEQNDILEWIYLIISLIFAKDFNAFDYMYEILQKENTSLIKFNENHYKFFIFLYHICLKIIENREQFCLIEEFFHKYKNLENNDFFQYQGNNNNKFGLFLIKKSNLSALMIYFNDLNKDFLNNLEIFLQKKSHKQYNKDDSDIVVMNKQLSFLNIWLKVFKLINFFFNPL